MAEAIACPKDFDLDRLQPTLVTGDTSQAVLSAEWIPEQCKKESIGSVYRLGFCEILKWVPLEFPIKGMSLWTVIGLQGVLVLFWMNLLTLAA